MRKLGYDPKVSIDNGLEKSIEWYLKNENMSNNKLL